MMKKKLIALFLCLSLFASLIPCAFAEDQKPEDMTIFSTDELTKLIEDYLSSKNINPQKVCIGFCYTATDEEWYYNGDKWIYPASVYKVPLMMLLSEKVKSGELTQESVISGQPVDYIEKSVIVNSNNDWAHVIRAYLGGDEIWRNAAKKYSGLSEADYPPDYVSYCYFSARYITGVLKTLYSAPDDFPAILDYMEQAKPKEYFRTFLEGTYTIAQKYGSYIEPNGTFNNHAVGIIYTPNPIIVTVMTVDVANYNNVIGTIATLLTNYALTLDDRLEEYAQQKLEAKIAAEEEARRKADAEEKAAQEAAQRAAEEEARRAEEQRIAEEEAAKQAKREKLKTPLIIGALVFAAAFTAVLVLNVMGKKKSKVAVSVRRGGYRGEEEDGEGDFEPFEELPRPKSMAKKKKLDLSAVRDAAAEAANVVAKKKKRGKHEL